MCPRNDRARGFKRKDHLTQHVRNCHRKLRRPEDFPDFDDIRRSSNGDSTSSSLSLQGIKYDSGTPRPMDDRSDLISDSESVLSALDTKDLIHEMMRRQSEQNTVLRRLEKRLEDPRLR